MGFFNHNLGFLTLLLLLLLLFLSLPFLALSLSPSSDDRQRRAANARSSTLVLDDRHRQGFNVMKPRLWASPPPPPFPRSNAGVHLIDDNGERSKRKWKHGGGRYDLGTGSSAAVFSAMLPRGFVPPSDSTWCHNDAPDAVELFCDEKSSTPRRP